MGTFEFGYVALDILYTYPEDEGEYVCKAFNELGEDITKAELKCKEMPAIQLENQVPREMKRSETLVQMEAAMKKYTTEMYLTEDDVYDSEKRQPPRFRVSQAWRKCRQQSLNANWLPWVILT